MWLIDGGSTSLYYNHTSQTNPGILDSLKYTQDQVEEQPIIREEVEEAIGWLTSGKARGINNILGEVLLIAPIWPLRCVDQHLANAMGVVNHYSVTEKA